MSTPARQPSTKPHLRALIGCVVGVGLMLAGVVVLIIPNSEHLDVANVGSDIFFDCGGALYPGSRPAEEPGISACSDINGSMLRWGLLLIIAGAVASLVAFWGLRRERD